MKGSCSGSLLTLTKGRTAIDGLSGRGSGRRFGRSCRRGLGRFFGLGDLGGLLLGAGLGVLARLALLRIHARGALLDAGGIEEAGDAIRRLGTDAQPVTRAVFVELHTVGVVLGEQRVVGADLLEILAVARRAAVGDDDAVIRTLLGATARKPD